jgi:hypothetical protein
MKNHQSIKVKMIETETNSYLIKLCDQNKSKLNGGVFDGIVKGLRLIVLIRKSKNKILYNFEKIND